MRSLGKLRNRESALVCFFCLHSNPDTAQNQVCVLWQYRHGTVRFHVVVTQPRVTRATRFVWSFKILKSAVLQPPARDSVNFLPYLRYTSLYMRRIQCCWQIITWMITFWSEQSGHIASNCFLELNLCILITISLKCGHLGPVKNVSSLV